MRAIRWRFIHRGTGPGRWAYELISPTERRWDKEQVDDFLKARLRHSICGHAEGSVIYRIPRKEREAMIAGRRLRIQVAREDIKILEAAK